MFDLSCYVTRVQYITDKCHCRIIPSRHIPFCGDPKVYSLPNGMLKENEVHWFPMRIRHSSLSRLEQIMASFDEQKKFFVTTDNILETYAPLGFIKVSMTKMDFAPYLLNYIFVRSTFKTLVEIKNTREDFEPLRFVTHPEFNEKFDRRNEVLTMTDKAMADYKRITAEENEKIVFLRDLSYACKPSREVQIIEGRFTGIIGRIKRIKGARCVVLPIGYEQAAAVVDVPNSHLRYLTDDEISKLAAEQGTTHRKHSYI